MNLLSPEYLNLLQDGIDSCKNTINALIKIKQKRSEMNQAINQLEIEKKVSIAANSVSSQISHLIPYLKHRQTTARKIQTASLTSIQVDELHKMLDWQNEEIKKIIGV